MVRSSFLGNGVTERKNKSTVEKVSAFLNSVAFIAFDSSLVLSVKKRRAVFIYSRPGPGPRDKRSN